MAIIFGHNKLLVMKPFILTIILLISACESTRESNSDTVKDYNKISNVLINKSATYLEYEEINSGVLEKSDSVLKYDEINFSFDLFQITSLTDKVKIRVKIPINDKILIPTLILVSPNGNKYPLKNILFDITSNTDFLICKWIASLPEKGKYYLLFASDNTENNNRIQSGVISYFSPAYYNFPHTYETSKFGSYQIALEAE